MVVERLVDELVKILARQRRQFRLGQRPRIDVTAENLMQLSGGILKVVLLRDLACLRARKSTLGLLQLRSSADA